MTGPWKTARLCPLPLPGKQHQAGHQGQHLDRETVQKDSQEYLLCKTMISIGTTSGKRPNLHMLLSRSRESPRFLPPMTSRLVWRGAQSLHVSSAGLAAVVGLPGAMSQPTLDSSDNRNDLQRLPDSLDTACWDMQEETKTFYFSLPRGSRWMCRWASVPLRSTKDLKSQTPRSLRRNYQSSLH